MVYTAPRHSGKCHRPRSGLAVGPFTGADAGHQRYLASLLLLVGYYGLWWRKNVTATGLKMPPVTPQFSLPAAMSPCYLRFITQCKYDDVAFSSDLLGLVAKRAITLTRKNQTKGAWSSSPVDEQWLSRQPDEKHKPLNPIEKQLMSLLFSAKRKNINLSTPHQTLMQNARRWLEKVVKSRNRSYAGHGVNRCVIVFILLCWFRSFAASDLAAAALTVPSLLFVSVGGVMTYLCLKFLRNPMKTLRSLGPVMILMALVFSPFATVAGGVFLLGMLPITQLPAGYRAPC